MVARTHDLAAFTTFGVIVVSMGSITVNLSTALLALLAVLLGGITPDIDQPTAPFWRNLPVGKYFGRVFGVLSGGHRFLTHSLLGLLLFGFASRWLLTFLHPIMPHVNSGYVWWAFMIGMMSHLVMDTFTKEGVPWLLPVPVKFGIPPIKRWRITTGKKEETFIIFPALIIFNVFFYWANYQTVLNILHYHVV